MLKPGNANRGWWGYFEIPPSEKFAENTPSKFWEIFLEKQRKTKKIKLI